MYSYYTIHNAVEQVLYKDKASKFYGFAYPVKNEKEIKEKLEFVKAQHPKATHHCYAYRIVSGHGRKGGESSVCFF